MAEASGPASFKRRAYLVDPHFQIRYALILAAWGAAVAGLCGLALHQAHQQAVELLRLDAEARALVAQSDRVLLTAIGAVAGLAALAMGIVGILLTHRVAGPAVVLGRHVRSLAAGRFPRVRALRRADELRRVFASLAEAVEAQRARESRRVARLEEAVAAMKAALPRAPELRPALESLALEVAERRAVLAEDLTNGRTTAEPVE